MIEHRVEPFPASWTAKGWQQRLDELAAEGWRFMQAIERVDGWHVILARQAASPALRPANGADVARDRTR